MIVTTLADEFADEVNRLSDFSIPIKACSTAEQALKEYTDETVLFGNPSMIARILPRLPLVDWVQSSWAGVKPLMDSEYRNYVLTGVKDVFGPQMSEYVIGFLLAHELRIIERMEAQREHRWFKGFSGRLEGKRLGVMGTGSIGQHIAKTGSLFGMQVTGISRSGRATEYFDDVMTIDQLYDFLGQIDYLVATLPDTDETSNLLDAAALAKLPEHAYFINVGRSNVVDDLALMNALKSGKLAGATLDVFDEEPVPENSPLWDTPKLTITAHIAAISHPLLLVPVFVENYRRYVEGRPLKYVIDFAARY